MSSLDKECPEEYLEDEKGRLVANGPMSNDTRSCTDLPCCVIFILFLCGFCYITYYGYTEGDPLKLSYPYDYDRNTYLIIYIFKIMHVEFPKAMKIILIFISLNHYQLF